jgi:uncharacterized protein
MTITERRPMNVRNGYRDRPPRIPQHKPGPPMMSPPIRPLLCLLSLMASACAQAAQPLSVAQQTRLDLAVIEYSSEHFDAARVAFEALARQGVPAAQFNLAVMHLKGQLPQPKPATARRLLESASRGGFITAQVMLAKSLESGDFGPRDLPQAHRWWLMAANAGDGEAQLAMGTAHFLGRGVKKDSARAAHWFREVAKAGDVGAQYLLASMYEQGDGLEQDLRLARYWYDAAAKNGDPAAPAKVKEMDARMTAAPA